MKTILMISAIMISMMSGAMANSCKWKKAPGASDVECDILCGRDNWSQAHSSGIWIHCCCDK